MDDEHGGDALSLDNQLCFALYSASRAFTGLYRELLADLGLTYPQYLVMLVLWERGAVPVKELGAALHLDSGTLSPLLRRLEAAGLVRRERSTEDERVVRAVPTERGSRLRERADGIPQRLLCSAGLSAGDARELRERLEGITASLTGAASAEAAHPPRHEE
ncbi:MarR family winged helix-turn-helix transcriptional regulator [Nocardiopsis composta]|uniref:DNA-binding MarR family transcriptional regulator n=1 Tax=Nocardiopsis composta TaxID=157465 RepID=A0A7W8VC94_9ACTN|nr:MarR family transcriptional regulator [Nocardiopsis composta]MBB5430735.1 DNA-binding MarR family transcriptional regulator [Nocardiopsis composta]